MTQYDRIKNKNMTIEEMADIFEMREFFAVAYNGEYNEQHKRPIDWLKSEVKNETD